MKLRITGNSVRLRLGRHEVSRLADGAVLEERAELAPTPLVYALSSSPDATGPTASFSDGRLGVALPRDVVERWAGSGQVGIAAQLGGVYLLVEKDFKCLHGDGRDDQPDSFPNPLAPAN